MQGQMHFVWRAFLQRKEKDACYDGKWLVFFLARKIVNKTFFS
jgi:hypothetical protein